ncbi:hypothetical protein [Actinomadura sp. KC345]|uniref:hypothetical protein n=1 Tax=Actinomadura sp. KC345 TaxID=2530371 RepID=UPI001404B188|nr:hypothetical protein [Actinomadura sp. KC345]
MPEQKLPGTPVTSRTATSGSAPARATPAANSSSIAYLMAPRLSGRSMVSMAIRSVTS